MKASNQASNSNNFKLRIFLKSQSKGESSSIYPILDSQKLVFGDDEKNHKKLKPLILYEDISDRQKSTTASSSSSQLKKITKRITQSIDKEINPENPFKFYQIIDNYYQQYINLPFKKDRFGSQEKNINKIQRLYTEQSEFKQNKQKPIKLHLTQSKYQFKQEFINVKEKILNQCKKNMKNIQQQ
ncbi:unnamed protein product [Paramecium pentaurelia]|uniref:Uncharacterized protein n=1 Tax=Paramecium pentaurelia TaxID=43138 RepID=A0A8S1UTZ4_9CILI|nr:unnamed protein product [Paramecium pentaurelia]